MGVRKINRRYFRLRLALLLEQILDQRFGVRAVPRTDADRLGDKPPVAIDQIGKRQAKRAVALRYVAMRIEQPLKCDAQLIEEMPDRRFILFEIHRDDNEPTILELAMQRFHHGHLVAARPAPRRPEIQEDHPADRKSTRLNSSPYHISYA